MIDEENYRSLCIAGGSKFIADIQLPVAKNILVSTTDWQKQTSFRFNGKITNRKSKINICLQVAEFKAWQGTCTGARIAISAAAASAITIALYQVFEILILCDELCRTQ